jgi:fatty acid desaturase
MSSPLSALYQDFVARGWNVKSTGRVVAEMVLHTAILATGLTLFFATSNLWIQIFALWVATMGGLGVGTNAHTGSHFAASKKRWVNWALSYYGYPFISGMSATYWHHKHVVVHHPTPNVAGLDDDIDLLPYFALNADEFERSRGLLRLWYRVQWVTLPIAILFNVLNLQFTGWKYVLGHLANPKTRTRLVWIDLGCLLAHLTTNLVLPMLFFPPLWVLAFYFVRFALMGYAIFIVFAPAHFPAEALFLTPGNQDRRRFLEKRDWILLQCATTFNIKTTWFGNLFCSGTDYQIEHHLFPGISHNYLPKMAPIVRAWCAENGYPYREVGFLEGFWKSWMTFRKPKPLYPEPDLARVEVDTADDQMVITQAELAGYQLL